jgi:hypothetical protein
MDYPYDPSYQALFTPALDVQFFPSGRSHTEAVLCAELSRLAYAPFERDLQAKQLVEATLRRVGFDSCTFISVAGTQGFVAQDSAAPLSILAFRGTELDPRDWATAINLPLVPWHEGGRVHQGFANALLSSWTAVTSALSSSVGRLLYTGHSLGAALATLTATRLPPVALYTYGSPRLGDARFAQAAAHIAHYRYCDCCDLICRIPPEPLGYRHCGPAAYLDRRGVLHTPPSPPSVRCDQWRARLQYLGQWAWRPGILWSRDAADHAPVNYLSALTRTPAPGPSYPSS